MRNKGELYLLIDMAFLFSGKIIKQYILLDIKRWCGIILIYSSKGTMIMGDFLYNLLKAFIDDQNCKKEKYSKKYIDDIFKQTEVIVRDYFDMFSEIRINVISGKFKMEDVINYLLKREYEVKEIRVLVRSFLKDKYYQNDEVKMKFVAAIYGIMECYPVKNTTIVDKTHHTIHSYIKFCQELLNEDEMIQKTKIIKMTDGILMDLTTSWETVCACFRELKK